MAAEGIQFSWRWNGGTISLNLGVIWEMSVNHVVEGSPHKTKEELIAELESLPQRLGDLEQMVEGRENADVPSEPFGDLNRVYKEAPIGLCCLDTDLRFLQINDWMAAINGLSVEDHLGRTIGEVLPDVAAGVEAQFRRVLETGEPILEGTVEAETPARPGIRRTFQHNYYPLKSGDGTVVGVSCVVQEITERKQADKAFKERYRRLLESTTAMPWEADARTWMFTYVGPQAVELLGYPRELWLEKDFWLDHIHPEDHAWAVDYCLKSSNQHENFEFEYRMIAADGRSVWLQDFVNVVKQEGEPVILQGFMFDITERKRAEELQRNLSARLISAQEEERMKISRELHDDFGQRLALLAVEIQRLGQNISEPEFEGAKSMDKLWSQARELSTDLSRLSHQLHPAILDQLGLGPAIRSLCSEISKQHGIQIKFTEHEVPASISQDISLCIYRIVQEGLRNIVKHSGAKDAKVELTGGPDTIHLRIADRGVGFDPATTKGKGIGLISIEERVRLVQGEMSLQSRPSHGTCIDLRIPSAVADA